MQRREFLNTLAVASAGGLALHGSLGQANAAASSFYDAAKMGNVHLLHFTDCHAQLNPIHYRDPNINLGVAGFKGKTPHLVGEALLKANVT